MSIKEYVEKRDFRKSEEPSGKNSGQKTHKPRFVIQKHKASSLHYDFRLEIDGVMKSWAVPKGLSTDPREKRLGVRTEDHPIEYKDFEGTITEGEYGAGTVMIWDEGIFRNLREEKKNDKTSLKASFDQGKIEVWLEGEKLKGGYVLIKTGKSNDKKWLIKKVDDDEADARRNPVSTEPKSVHSGKSLKQIKEDSK